MFKDDLRLAWGGIGARRRAAWLVAATMVWLVALAPVTATAAEYTIGPPPAWVVPVEPGAATPDEIGQASGGEVFLLTDTQVQAGEQRATYHRMVATAINASGVNAMANIEIAFDPSYQKLALHSINIVRNGHIIPKLATARIRVLQRETELEARIYDGTKTVNVFLDDVREGDTIDYSYSTTGRNPVFKGLEFGYVPLQYSLPVARIHVRLLLPLNKHITFATRNTAIKPVMSEHNGWRDYGWDVTHPPALKVENDTPFWYFPFADVGWSEFADWASVAHWAQPLYQVPSTLSPALQEQVDRIAKAEPTPAGRMLAALRLVQGDIRYLGVEIGQSSHAPNPPALVFDRRFGDCKDKTLLTLTLLSHLGIEAHAALVNTLLQRGLANVLPSAAMFDHVLVQARIDGKTWWIDPTRYTQKADISHLYQPDYGLALVVDSHTQALTAMTHADASSAARHLDVVFDASAGFDKPAHYNLETTITGKFAEAMRVFFSATSPADVEKKYLNFRALRYPHIASAAPMQVKDDETDNRIVTKESYTITDMLSPSSDSKRQIVNILLPDITDVLREPSVTVRKSPLRLAYPQDVSQRTVVLLPQNWPLKPNNTVIDDPAFHFEQTVSMEGSLLVITDHYQALADEVAAQDMPRYVSNLTRAREIAGYEIAWNKTSATSMTPATSPSGLDRMNWPLVLLAIGMFGVWTWLAVVAYRYDPPPADTGDNRWVGIGGWLIWLTIGLSARPLVYGYFLMRLPNAMSIDRWAQLTTYGSHSYNALWAPVLLMEMANASAQFVFSLLLIVLLFRHRSNFPRVALVVLISGVVAHLVDAGLASMIPAVKAAPHDDSQIMWDIVSIGLWSAYLLQSQRVKATFVKRYRVIAPSPLSTAASGTIVNEPAG